MRRSLSTHIDDVRFDDDVDVWRRASKLDGNLVGRSRHQPPRVIAAGLQKRCSADCQEILNKDGQTHRSSSSRQSMDHCVGGGLEIAMATDASRPMEPGGSGCQSDARCSARTGGTQRPAEARREEPRDRLMATGRMLTPKEALDWGLLNRSPRAKFWEGRWRPPRVSRTRSTGPRGRLINAPSRGAWRLRCTGGLALERELRIGSFAWPMREGFRGVPRKEQARLHGNERPLRRRRHRAPWGRAPHFRRTPSWR